MLFAGAEEPQEPPKPKGQVEGLRCAEPGCNGLLVLRWSIQLNRWFYGCVEWPKCHGILPANMDGSPRGKPRTRELQGWRNQAHEAFDCLWKEGHVSRGGAYSWLQEVMEMSSDEAHMFEMNVEQCQKVVEKVETHGPGTAFWKEWRGRSKKRRRRRRHGTKKKKSV
jgi:ssDNA-binding Zn-finger/Zn-ribbon topoisomerase 1